MTDLVGEMAGNYKARSVMSVNSVKTTLPRHLFNDLTGLLAIEPNLVTSTFQFHATLLAANTKRQVVGIMYKHLSPQSVFSDRSVRLFEKLQKTWVKIFYIGANIAEKEKFPACKSLTIRSQWYRGSDSNRHSIAGTRF